MEALDTDQLTARISNNAVNSDSSQGCSQDFQRVSQNCKFLKGGRRFYGRRAIFKGGRWCRVFDTLKIHSQLSKKYWLVGINICSYLRNPINSRGDQINSSRNIIQFMLKKLSNVSSRIR